MTRVAENRNIRMVLEGRSENKRSFRWKDNIQMDLDGRPLLDIAGRR